MRLVGLGAIVSIVTVAACSSKDESPAQPVATVDGPGADAGPGPIADTAAPATSNLESTACRFNVPASIEGQGDGKMFRCYDLSVPENRSVAGSRTIKVHLIVFKGKEGGVPTIELNGGPGGPSEDMAVGLALGQPEMKDSLGRFLALGDYVMVDQRGTGRSIPRLGCSQNDRGGADCVARIKAQGVDLTGYVTSENADDIHDLKVALGAPQVNLHGISYGTRLALEVLRRHPEDVRAAIIDGVLPAQAKALSEGDINNDDTLTRIFQACAANSACNAKFPNLDQALGNVKAKLDATPYTIFGQTYDWYAFAGELLQSLSGEGVAADVPFRIYDILEKSKADYEAATEANYQAMDQAQSDYEAELAKTPLGAEVLARRQADPDPQASEMADAMYQAVVCSDYVQYESVQDALANEAKVREIFRDTQSVNYIFSECNAWPKRAKATDVWAPVVSDRPVLAVSGTMDPLTPNAWRDLASQTLSNVKKATAAAGAHGQLDPCAMSYKVSFLTDPAGSPDVSCAAAETIDFVLEAPPGGTHSRLRHPIVRPRIIHALPSGARGVLSHFVTHRP